MQEAEDAAPTVFVHPALYPSHIVLVPLNVVQAPVAKEDNA